MWRHRRDLSDRGSLRLGLLGAECQWGVELIELAVELAGAVVPTAVVVPMEVDADHELPPTTAAGLAGAVTPTSTTL